MYLQHKNRSYSILHLLESSRSFRQTVHLSYTSYDESPFILQFFVNLLIYLALVLQILFMPIPVLLGRLLNRTEVCRFVFSMSLLHDFFGALFHFQQTKYLESNYTWGCLLSALLLVRPIAIYNELISCNAYRPDYLQSELNSQSVAEVKGFHQWNYPMSLALRPYENWRGYINGYSKLLS